MWESLGLFIFVSCCFLFMRLRGKAVERQEMFVAAWQDAEDAHPGLYTKDLAREQAKLDAMRKKHPDKPPKRQAQLTRNPA